MGERIDLKDMIVMLLLSLAMTCRAPASTTWNSDIEGNVTWTTAGSPYLVTSSITVQRQAVLTIQAGVIVKMNSGKSITIAAPYGAEEGGRIVSQGTSGNPVVFTSYRDDTYGGDTNGDGPSTGQKGDWGYIRFNNGNNTLENCLIRYGGIASYGAVYVYQCSPTIRNNVIEYSHDDGIYCYKMTSGSITGNTIRNCGTAYAGQDGISLSQSSPTIANCIIVNNRGYGICENDTSSDPVVKYCLFNNNQDGDYRDENLYVYIGANNINNNVAGASNNIDGDPLFKNTVDYHLSFGSPCIDAGDPAGTYTGQKDIDGEARVLNGRVDIGADECGGGQGGVKPVISNVIANQRTDSSKAVDIYYDLADQDSPTLSVSVKVSSDGGSTYAINPVSLSGDVGASVPPGTGRHIIWNAGNDLPGAYGTNYRVRICANDGSGDVFGYSNVFVIDNHTGTGFRITSLVPAYAGVFPEGVEVINTITTQVNWSGKTPSRVVFSLNGQQKTVYTSGTTAQTTFNMGQDLSYSRSGAKNEIRVWAIASDSSSSPAMIYNLWGLELPEWAISLETKKGPINYRIEQTGKLAFYGEVEILKERPGGTVNIPDWLPEVGGEYGVTINPLNFEWELAALPRIGDGAGLTGSFDLAGTWGAEAKCGKSRKGEVSATLSGAGEFYPQFKLSDVSAELAGKFTFLFPRVPLLCHWGCCHTGYCPYFQASIAPEISGTVGMEEGEPSLIAGLKFKNSELNLAVTVAGTVGAGSEGSIYFIAGTIGGKPYIVLQFPGDPDSSCLNEYIKKVAFDLKARAVFECAWWKWEENWTFNLYTCPETGMMYAMGIPSGERRVVPVAREYLQAPEGYCVFPSPKGGLGILSVGGLPDPILNVGTGPMPSVAATSDEGLLLFTYDDPCKPTGKHQEIYYARWNGSQWTTHAPLTDNINPDLFPVAVIDPNGTEVAVWVSAAEPNGFETGPRDILPGLELTYSQFDSVGGNWTTLQNITSNGFADLLPWFNTNSDGTLRVCWISSSANALPVWHDEEIAPLIDVMASDWDGLAFGAPYTVASGLVAVSPPALVQDSTHEYLAYLKDMDNNSGTAQDREVYVTKRLLGGVWETEQALTNDALSDSAAQMVINDVGNPTLVWVKRMVPLTFSDPNLDTHIDQLWFSEHMDGNWIPPSVAFEDDGITEPKLFKNAAGKVVLFWVAASEEFSDIYYSVYDAELMQWGLPQQITHDQGAETMISLSESGGNILASYVKRRIDLSDPYNPPVVGLSDIYMMEHVPAKDLYVNSDDISFDPKPMPDANSLITANIHLSGDFTVIDIKVQLYDGDPASDGQLISTQTISQMLPGQAEPITALWHVPKDGLAHLVYVLVDPNNTIPETDDLGNNKAYATVFSVNLLPKPPVAIGYPAADKVIVGVSVKNTGSMDSEAFTCQVRKDDAAGPVLFETSFEKSPAGQSVYTQFEWDVTGEPLGIYDLVVIADPNHAILESQEDDNISIGPIPVLPDLQAEQWSVGIDGPDAYITIRNVGPKPSEPNMVRVMLEEWNLGEAPVPALDPGQSADITVSLSQLVEAGRVDITVNPDSLGDDEVTLLNNTASIILFAPGDFDSDGDVDLSDLLVISEQWLESPGTPSADIAPDPLDDFVDLQDFARFAEYWLTNFTQ